MESVLLFLIDHFPNLLDVNLTASIAILFVVCVRQFMKGAPKIFSYALWAIVLLRLLVPISIESRMSFVPERTEFSSMVDVNEVFPEVQFETPQDRADNAWYRENTPPGEPLVQTNRSLDAQTYLTFAWLAGIVFMLLRSAVSYWKLRKKVRVAIPFQKGIYIADDIDTPFVMGFLRPKIYLSGILDPSEREYIIAHERHHIRRGDHIFKALAFLALTIHWFNPFVWAAFVLAGRDMEMSCDEAVIRKLGEDVRAEYSASLLNLATGQRLFAGTPLAFGEGDPTGRVRNLAKWKKPAFWVILICVIVCIILAVCLLTDPEMPFPTVFEQYFVTDKKVELLSGSTNEISSKLHITLKSTSGPQKLTLELWYHRNSEEQWVKKEESVISTQDTCTFTVPSDSMFAVAATADGGKNGYATVALSAGQGIVFDKFEHDLLTRSNTKSADEAASAWTVPEEAEERPSAQEWGITMQAQSATLDSVDLILSLDEQSVDAVYYVGETYHLYLWSDQQWVELPDVSDDSNESEMAAIEHLTPLLPGTPVDYPIGFPARLSPGKYRIQMAITKQVKGEYPVIRPIFAEFTLPGAETWAVTIQAHDVTPESLVLTYHNASESSFYRLPGYRLRHWQNDEWGEIDVGKTWNETTEEVDFEHQSQPGNGMYIQWDGIGTLPEGQYLIGQEFCTEPDPTKGQRFTVYASFEINGESGKIKSLEELPELYSAEQAMIDGCFVSEDGVARHNQEIFHSFAQNAANGIPGFIRMFNCHYGEDYQWKAMDLRYDGEQFILQGSDTYTFRYLKHFTGEKDRPDAAYDSYEYYVLTNDNTVTWDDVLNHRVDSEEHWTVYAEFTYRPKHPDLPDRPNYAILEFAGDGLITITDSDRLEKLVYLFENAEFLGYEPKAHSIGVGLNLVFTSGDKDFIIELDPDSDVCRINGEYASYSAPDEPDYIYKLWEYLGITQWPDIVYMVCENALRP